MQEYEVGFDNKDKMKTCLFSSQLQNYLTLVIHIYL